MTYNTSITSGNARIGKKRRQTVMPSMNVSNMTTTATTTLMMTPTKHSFQPLKEDNFVMDVIHTMYRQESSIYRRLQTSYFQNSSITATNNNNDHTHHHQPHHHNRSNSNKTEVVASWRSMLIEWMFQVADFSHVKRESIGVAVYFLDLCITKLIPDWTCKKSFQLAAATCLQLAVKTHDCKVIKLKDLTILGRGVFTEEEIMHLELQIIAACQWKLHPPSVYCFVQQYMELLHIHSKTKSSLYSIVKSILEMTLKESKYKQYPPSAIAYGAILIAMGFVENPSNIMPTCKRYFCQAVSSSTLQNCSSRLLISILHDIQASCSKNSHFDCSRYELDYTALVLEHLSLVDWQQTMDDDGNSNNSSSNNNNKKNSGTTTNSTTLLPKSVRGGPPSPIAVIDTTSWSMANR